MVFIVESFLFVAKTRTGIGYCLRRFLFATEYYLFIKERYLKTKSTTRLSGLILRSVHAALYDTRFVSQGYVYQRWSSIWTFVGTELVYLGSFGCWSADGNPFGYVNHWRYHGGWIYVDEYGNVFPWGYGWWQGYSYPDGPRQMLGPRDVTYTTDFYKCWRH